MQQFQIILKNEKVKQYERIASFIIIINLALFVYISVSARSNADRISAIAGAAIMLASLSITYFFSAARRKKYIPYKLIALCGVSIIWCLLGFWWIGVLCVLLAFLYFTVKKPLMVNTLAEKIIYPSFPKKNIDWVQLNNVVLKDSLLTIDFKNNKIIQQYVDESKPVVNEQEFNDFCRQQLNK